MNDFLISIFKGFYPYFAIPALFFVIYRIRKGLWTSPETLLLLFIFIHVVLETLQILIGTKVLYMSRRYLLPCAPLLFGWFAWGIAGFLRRFRCSCNVVSRVIFYIILSGMTAVLLIDGLMPTIKNYTSPKKRHERKIVKTLAPLLRKDYTEKRFLERPADATRYLSPFHPVVVSRYPALGYWSGGSHTEDNSRCDYIVKEISMPPSNAVLKFKVEISECLYGIYIPRKMIKDK